jgi:hypothetical protein
MDYAAGGRKNLPAYGGNLGDFWKSCCTVTSGPDKSWKSKKIQIPTDFQDLPRLDIRERKKEKKISKISRISQSGRKEKRFPGFRAGGRLSESRVQKN